DVIDRLPEETIFLVPAGMEVCKWRILELLGIAKSRCMEYDGSVPWELERLIHATPSAHCGNHNKEAVAWVDRTLSGNATYDASLKQHENIYIRRSRSSCRRIANEREIQCVLDEFGFATVFLESLTFDQQIQLLRGARKVLSPHGAGLSNIVFCRPG